MRSRLGITGSPGTGKKTLAPLVASLLSYSLLDLNVAARGYSKLTYGNVLEIDTERLGRKVAGLVVPECVVFGHLLPHVIGRHGIDFVAVLRCEPTALKKRLLARGYRGEKLTQNLEAELIGVVLDECIHSFGESKVREYDSTKEDPDRLAEMIATDYRGRARHAGEWIDWTRGYTSSARLRSLLSFARADPAST